VDGSVRLVAVELGEPAGDEVEVLSGVQGGDRVVVNAPAELADGSRVRVR
jgi:multidrug efflux pump subunit AcrA (membrane-fusion protein)